MNEYRKYILVGFIIGFAFFTIMNRGEKMKPLFFNSIIINIMNNVKTISNAFIIKLKYIKVYCDYFIMIIF